MTKELNGIIVEYARKYFKESGRYDVDAQGNVEVEVYTDYRDTLDASTINEAFERYGDNIERVRDYLHEYIFDAYIDSICDLEYELCDEVAKYIENNIDSDTYAELEREELEVSDIREILIDNSVISVYVDADDILCRSNIDLIISLENSVSSEHEFSLNNFNGDVLGWIEETQEAIEDGYFEESDISLITLLKTQGYTFEEFKKEAEKFFTQDHYNPKSKFIKSLIEECYNTTSMCNALVFTKEMNLLDYLKDSSIKTIKKGTCCGYIDFVYGGGSVIDIVLEKDISLDYIEHEIFVDCRKYGYSFRDIYGEFIC